MLNFMICSFRGRECPYEFDFFIAAMIITPNCVFSFSSEYSNKGIISEWLVINPAIRLPVHPDDAPLFFLIWDPKQAFLFDGHFIRDCVAKDWQAKLPSCPFCPHMNPSFDCQLHYSENLNSFQSNRVKLSQFYIDLSHQSVHIVNRRLAFQQLNHTFNSTYSITRYVQKSLLAFMPISKSVFLPTIPQMYGFWVLCMLY